MAFAVQSTYKRVDPRTMQDVPVRLDTLQLDVGVVGPAAGGAFVQNNFHRFIGDTTANGWGNQLHNEPAIDLTFERRWRTNHGVVFDDPKLEYDVVPRIGEMLGNVETYASAGGTFRIGKDLQSDFDRPFVAEFQAGLTVLFRGVRLSFTQVLRTPEFYERDRWDQFASINVSFRY